MLTITDLKKAKWAAQDHLDSMFLITTIIFFSQKVYKMFKIFFNRRSEKSLNSELFDMSL